LKGEKKYVTQASPLESMGRERRRKRGERNQSLRMKIKRALPWLALQMGGEDHSSAKERGKFGPGHLRAQKKRKEKEKRVGLAPTCDNLL